MPTRLKTVAEFQIAYLQRVGAGGEVAGELPAFARDDAELQKMYRLMTLCRLFDAKAINLQRTGKLGTYAPCTGHEATHDDHCENGQQQNGNGDREPVELAYGAHEVLRQRWAIVGACFQLRPLSAGQEAPDVRFMRL